MFLNYLTRVLLHCFNLPDHWLNLKNVSNQSGPRYQDLSILHFPRFFKGNTISSRQSPFQVHSNRIEEAGTRCPFLWQITRYFCNNKVISFFKKKIFSYIYTIIEHNYIKYECSVRENDNALTRPLVTSKRRIHENGDNL